MKTVCFVFGTRPEAIKMVPVIKKFQSNSQQYKTLIIVTAQHREMLDQVLSLFGIKPDIDLNLMSSNQTLEGLSSKILCELSLVYEKHKPK